MSVKIAILGDICPEWGFPEQFETGDAQNVFHDILPRLQAADLVVANLEAPATACIEKMPKNSINLKARPNDVSVLKAAGIDGVALANNHILDYGVDGLRDTVNTLERETLFYYGLSNRDNQTEAHICRINGVRIGLLAFAEREFNCAVDYGNGAALWDDLESPQIITQAKAQCDYLIVQYHGGIEHYIYPSPYLQKKCRAMANAGADFVTCQHSHCIGTHETWHGSEILYGQGNAIFGTNPTAGWNNGLLAEITIDDTVTVTYIPITAKPDGEYVADPQTAQTILQNFESASAHITDPAFVQEQWTIFCQNHTAEYLPLQFAWGRITNKLNRMTNGRLMTLFTKRLARRNAMNLIRCDAHREVVQTILEKDCYGD